MTKILKTAVIGVGYLGRFHAQKYNSLDNCKLVAVVDTNAEQAQKVGQELGVEHLTNYESLLDNTKIDAVSIVVPTTYHYKVAKDFLSAGINALLEKPFAATVAEAEELKQISEDQKLCLQIGHLERFNMVFLKLKDNIKAPKLIESKRIAPFPARGTDVDVILDLMIHDLDLIIGINGEYPSKVEGLGVPLLTDTADVAHARLYFPNGCIANLMVSRVATKAERAMRIFENNRYLSIDFGSFKGKRLIIDPNKPLSPESLKPEVIELDKGDNLLEEIKSFTLSIINNTSPKVTANDGLLALKAAWEIKEKITGNIN